jgi:hypothetical protein
MRKITTAITAAALAFSMMAAAVPAAAVTGYDSAYAGESAFVNIVGGQTQNFQVFFANTGTASWVKGTGTQVDLAACLEDKVTCNAQDASEATWNSGWLSAVRYASTSQTTTPPGSLGTFSYNIMAPVGVAAGIFHFNGDLVVAATGERIHPEGYFQDANTGAAAGAATLTSLTPTTGSANGGTTVSIAGSGIVCNPTFPTVSFGGTNAVVTSCGATALTVTTPAHAPGAVTVTVTNPGASASNGLTFSFADTTTPKFNSFTVSGNLVTVTWSEAVCKPVVLAGTVAQDWTIMNIATSTTNTVTADSTPTCNTALDNLVTTSTLQLSTAMPNGAFVEATLNAVGTSTTRNQDYQDAAGNTASAPQARQATATAPETTQPVLVSAQGAVGATQMTLTFSEAIYCTGLDLGTPATASTDIAISDGNASTVDPTVTGAGTNGNVCGGSPTTADTSFSVNLSSALPADRTYTLTITPDSATEVRDIVGNPLGDGAGNACYLITGGCAVAFTTGAGDFTPPTIVDARMVNNLGTSDFGETIGDSFSATFSEAMNGTTTGVIQVQDQDGSVITLTCNSNVACSWNTAVTTVTVTVTAATTPPAIGTAGSGTTPGFQIPFNVTQLTGFTDLQGNVPNVLGSSDRLVDYE